jgi:hypothetical protein
MTEQIYDVYMSNNVDVEVVRTEENHENFEAKGEVKLWFLDLN